MDNQMNQISKPSSRRKIMAPVFGLFLIVGLISAGWQSATAVTVGPAGKQVKEQAAISSGATAVVRGNAIAVRASIQVARQNPAQSSMYIARVQAAVYNAVVAID